MKRGGEAPFPRRSKSARGRQFLIAIGLAAAAAAALGARAVWRAKSVAAVSPTVFSADFEDGQDGFFAFGSASLTVVSGVAQSGTHSLLTSNRSASFMGPATSLTSALTPGATYQFTMYAMMAPGAASSPLLMTMQRTPTGGSAAYDWIGSPTTVTSTGWTQLTGIYSFSGSVSGLNFYVQSNDGCSSSSGSTPCQSFYIDNVTVTEIAPPPNPGGQDNSGLSTTFEDGTTDGWGALYGLCKVAAHARPNPDDGSVYDGNYDLAVTGRAADYTGPFLNVSDKMYQGSSYSVSVWARLAAGEGPTDLRLSLRYTLGGTAHFATLATTEVTSGGWTELATPNFTLSSAYDAGSAEVYVESTPDTADNPGDKGLEDFYIDDFQLTYLPPPVVQTNLPSVYQTLASYFPIGAAIDTADLTGPHAQLLAQHFDSIVSENDMKWQETEPTEGNFTFTTADAEVAFAQAHNMKVRGTTLVWYQQTPAWVFEDASGNALDPSNPADQALVLKRMQNHIAAVVGHYKGEVYCWDVVNEAIDPSQADGLRHNQWWQFLGPGYIADAFNAAHAADPSAELFLNDYSTTDPERAADLYSLISSLQQQGVPINGLGHEMHSQLGYPSAQAIVSTVNQFAQLGIDQQITELDLSVYTNGTSSYPVIPPILLAEQGYQYRDYFNAFRSLKGELSAVTFWGLADDHTWLDSFPINRLNMPLLFDLDLQAKPAYWGVVDPSQLPGAALTGNIAGKAGASNARVWTITMSNPGPGIAYGTQINGFTLKQTYGAACAPVVTPPSSYPVMLGDIASEGTASAAFTIDFSGCPALARFSLSVPFSSTGGFNSGAIVRGNQFR